jgi:hypothetical protein
MASGPIESALQPPLASHKLPHTLTIIMTYISLDFMGVFLKIHDKSKDTNY